VSRLRFPARGSGGPLNATERSLKYKAQAVEYDDVREFPGLTPKSRRLLDEAVAVKPFPS